MPASSKRVTPELTPRLSDKWKYRACIRTGVRFQKHTNRSKAGKATEMQI